MAERCIAANVARLRLDRELTQAELARRAGLSRVAVGKIERGEVEPQARTLDALAKALEVPIGKLATPVRRLASVRFRARESGFTPVSRSWPRLRRDSTPTARGDDS